MDELHYGGYMHGDGRLTSDSVVCSLSLPFEESASDMLLHVTKYG